MPLFSTILIVLFPNKCDLSHTQGPRPPTLGCDWVRVITFLRSYSFTCMKAGHSWLSIEIIMTLYWSPWVNPSFCRIHLAFHDRQRASLAAKGSHLPRRPWSWWLRALLKGSRTCDYFAKAGLKLVTFRWRAQRLRPLRPSFCSLYFPLVYLTWQRTHSLL